MRLQILILVLLLAAGCAPALEPEPPPDAPVTSPPGDPGPTAEPVMNPFEPRPGDSMLARDGVSIAEASLIIRESFPPQVSVVLSGELPTPCHQLRAEIAPPDAENRIVVDVYTVVNAELACIQVIEPFEASIDLGTFPTGHYTVWVNGTLAGEFDT